MILKPREVNVSLVTNVTRLIILPNIAWQGTHPITSIMIGKRREDNQHGESKERIQESVKEEE